jgi:predicted nuclease with TOPRIM domain
MTQKEIEQIYKAVYDYSVLKKQLKAEKTRLEEQFRNNEIREWYMVASLSELYRDVEVSPEREAFIAISKQANTDPVIEKYLRAAHSEYFLGRPMDPTTM